MENKTKTPDSSFKTHNPFVTDIPVSGKNFLAREEIIGDIALFLKKKLEITMLVYGERKVGKTSLLKKIQKDTGILKLAVPLYFNLQDKTHTPLSGLLYDIALSIDSELGLGLAGKRKEKYFPVHYFKGDFITAAAGKLPPGKSLLLLFDETDVMGAGKYGENETGIHSLAYKSFISFIVDLLREIRQKVYPVKFIFAVGSEYKDPGQKQFDRIARFGTQLEIPYFTREETRQLLKNIPIPGITFEEDAVEAIYALTSGHPYFTQCLAGVSFDFAVKKKQKRVTPVIVQQQLMQAVKSYSSSVYWIWNSFSPGDQVILYLMAVIKEDNQPITSGTLHQKASLLNALPALEDLHQILERLKTIGFIKEHREEERESQYDFHVEFLRKWVATEVSEEDIFEKKRQLAEDQGVTRQKGVLLLADIIDFTSQAEQLGAGKTRQFEQTFESTIKTMAKKYKGDYIKSIGDAVLLFFAEETNALDFALRLREASRQRELDRGEFACSLRIVLHFGKFDFLYSQGFLTDVTGAEAIEVFRIEKWALKNEILVTQILLQLIEGELKDKGIWVVKMRDEPLKGQQRPTAVYRLKVPTKEIKTTLLMEKMGELERETRKIPVFGNIYPAMSMEENFINLDISSEEKIAAKERERGWRDSIQLRKDKRFQQERLPREVSQLYERFNRGIIFGLPGSGKTTILKYFAFRELKKNAVTPDPAKKRIVMFIQCRDIMSYNDWYRQYPGIGADRESGIEYSIGLILGYLAHSFLFNWKAPGGQDDVQGVEVAVQRAYFQGRLTLLIDALDEAPDREVKDNIIIILKELFFHSKEGNRYGNRFYLTSRYLEKDRFPANGGTATLKPVFDVRSLDMEQLRQMAEYFYRDNPVLYKEFDRVVWQEEIAAKVGGTPLTALLVIAYFQCFKKFDTRFHMYHVLLVFILIRAWKEIKEGNFNKDMKTFFEEAKSLVVLEEKPYISAGKIYDALTLLAYGYIGKQEEITEEDLLDIFRLFIREKEKPGEAKKEAQRWLNRLGEDQLLVPSGLSQYVFIHKTVMEYLAARYLVEKLNDPCYLVDKFPIKNIDAAVEKVNPEFFYSETLPIAVGSGIREGAHILRILEKLIAKAKDRERQNILYLTALKSLAEWESYIDRQYQRRRLEYLHLDREKQINDNWDAVDWIYKHLADIILNGDKKKLKTAIREFKNISKLSRPYFLEKYLTYEAFSEGDSEIISLRKELLDKIIKEELADQWLTRHMGKKEETGGGLLTLDARGYHPEDKNFQYYKEYSGKELIGFLGSPNLKHSGVVTCAVFSPDGKYIISSSSDNTLKLWDAASGKEMRTFKGHSDYVRSVCFAPDGQTILSGSDDKTLKLWDAASGKEMRTFKGHTNLVTAVCFSPDGQTILSGSSDNTLKLWDAVSVKEMRTFKGHSDYVRSVCFATDGKTILSGSDDKTLKLWDVSSGKEVRTFKGHSDYVGSTCFAPDGKTILSGSDDNSLKLWDVETGKEIRTFKGHSWTVNSVCFAPDGKTVLSGSSDTTLKLWDAASGKEIRTFKGHSWAVNSVGFSPGGKTILSASSDTTLKLWDILTGKEVRTFKGHSDHVRSVGFAPGGDTILSGSEDTTLKLWDVSSGKEVRTFKGHSGSVWTVDFAPGGGTMLSGSEDTTLKLWDISSGKEVRTFKGHSGSVWSVSFAPGGTTVLSGSEDATLKLWDVRIGKEVRTFKGHSGSVWSVNFAPGGKTILSGFDDNTLKLWDVESGKEIQTFKGHENTINSVSFAPGGKTILSGSSDTFLKLWDVRNGKVLQTFKGHRGDVRSACFAPDGKIILSVSSDQTLKTWDIETGQCLKTIPLLWIPLEIKAFPNKPGIFATANANGTVTFFDLSPYISR